MRVCGKEGCEAGNTFPVGTKFRYPGTSISHIVCESDMPLCDTHFRREYGRAAVVEFVIGENVVKSWPSGAEIVWTESGPEIVERKYDA